MNDGAPSHDQQGCNQSILSAGWSIGETVATFNEREGLWTQV